jgi:hypothetical protein
MDLIPFHKKAPSLSGEGVGDEVLNKKGCNKTAFLLFSIQ